MLNQNVGELTRMACLQRDGGRGDDADDALSSLRWADATGVSVDEFHRQAS